MNASAVLMMIGFCSMVAAISPVIALVPIAPRERRFSPPQRQPWWWGIA